MFEVVVEVVVDGEGGASAHAEALWEEGRALYVAESPGRLVIGFAERAASSAAARSAKPITRRPGDSAT